VVNKKALVAYVPALHAGYVSFFKKHKDADLFVLGTSLIALTPVMERDIRAITPKEAVEAIAGLGIFKNIKVLEKKSAPELLRSYKKYLLPDEDISRNVAKALLKRKSISFESIFLRWDKLISTAESVVSPDRTISVRNGDLKHLREAAYVAKQSGDWWRQVGAVLVKGKKIQFRSYNRHFPSDTHTAIVGDPRSNFNAGEHPEIYLSIHAEADIVAQAAREGVSLKGSEMFVTTFPCPNCARLLIRAGVKRMYYAQGYSKLDAEEIFKSAGVEMVLVKGA